MKGSEQHPHLASLFDQHCLMLGNRNLVYELEKCWLHYPWIITGVDWDSIEASSVVTLDMLETSEGNAVFLKESGFEDCSFAAALLEPPYVPIVGKPTIVFANLDSIFWRFPGRRMVIGCMGHDLDDITPVSTRMAEYDGADVAHFLLCK